MSQSSETIKRINKIRGYKWIGYSAANAALDKMEDLMIRPEVNRMKNMLIHSNTNNGKTTVINELMRRHPVKRCEINGGSELPVLVIEMPPDAGPDSIYMAILDALHAPYPPNTRKENKAKQVLNIMRRLKVRLLIIDEIHTILDANRMKQNQVINTIKYLGNQLKISIVAVGTLEARNVFKSDDQLSNRFKPFELPKWSLNLEYRKLLVSFEQLIDLKKPSGLDSEKLAIEIMSMSEGWIGEISEIIEDAAVAAIKSGEEQITLETLKRLNWQSPSQRRGIPKSGN